MTKLETKVIFNKPSIKPEVAVIWLHGLGADYNDFVPLVPELKIDISAKFIFPNAPIIPVTINNGYKMRAWYDILDFSNLHREVDKQGIVDNVTLINHMIDDLIAEGFTADKIIIAGFSQGGVIAYYTALNHEKPLGGLLVLSSYLPEQSLLDVAKTQHKKGLNIFICHGRQDPVVQLDYAKQALQCLQSFSLEYEFHEYNMEHSVCYEEIVDISAWMMRIFAK